MDFTSLVLAARPNIKPNSAKAYATSLKLLAPEGAADLDFLLDPEPILGEFFIFDIRMMVFSPESSNNKETSQPC